MSARDRLDEECGRPDCQQIALTASEVYCDITGGLLSYPTYDSRTILAHANDYTQRLIDEETATLVAEVRALQARLAEVREEHIESDGCCSSCVVWFDNPAEWPCPTIRAITDAEQTSGAS